MLCTLLFFQLRIHSVIKTSFLIEKNFKLSFELLAVLAFFRRNEICLLLLFQMPVMEFICVENRMVVFNFVKKAFYEFLHVFPVLPRY